MDTIVKNARNSNASKNNQKNSSLKIKRKKTRKMLRKVKKHLLNFINSETENITEGENHFGFESSTEEKTKISSDTGLTINNLFNEKMKIKYGFLNLKQETLRDSHKKK